MAGSLRTWHLNLWDLESTYSRSCKVHLVYNESMQPKLGCMQNWELDKSEGNGAVLKWSDEFQRVCGIFGITYAAEVDNFPPVDQMELQALKMFMVTHLPSRRPYCDFALCDAVHYLDRDNESDIGRWLGVSHTIGNLLTYHILCDTRRVTQTSDVAHIPLEQWCDQRTQAAIKACDGDKDIRAFGPGSFHHCGET